MNQASRQAIDAISASPAIRLRYAIAAAKAPRRPPQSVPPAVGGETLTVSHPPTSYYAFQAGDPRAVLLRLREEAANEIDRLLEFLDATEGDVDLEGPDEDGAEPEHNEDTGDFEPSLGWTVDGVSTHTGLGILDAEENHDVEATDGRPVWTAACGRAVLA